MIFAVAGTQLPFPRLMTALDRIAGETDLQIVAQCADEKFQSETMTAIPFLPGTEFEAMAAKCRVIVAHAGIGIIMTAAKHGKPLIIMPRRADLGEHRNDHQQATARRFADVPGITVVCDAEELKASLLAPELSPVTMASNPHRESLIAAVSKALF